MRSGVGGSGRFEPLRSRLDRRPLRIHHRGGHSGVLIAPCRAELPGVRRGVGNFGSYFGVSADPVEILGEFGAPAGDVGAEVVPLLESCWCRTEFAYSTRPSPWQGDALPTALHPHVLQRRANQFRGGLDERDTERGGSCADLGYGAGARGAGAPPGPARPTGQMAVPRFGPGSRISRSSFSRRRHASANSTAAT